MSSQLGWAVTERKLVQHQFPFSVVSFAVGLLSWRELEAAQNKGGRQELPVQYIHGDARLSNVRRTHCGDFVVTAGSKNGQCRMLPFAGNSKV